MLVPIALERKEESSLASLIFFHVKFVGPLKCEFFFLVSESVLKNSWAKGSQGHM